MSAKAWFRQLKTFQAPFKQEVALWSTDFNGTSVKDYDPSCDPVFTFGNPECNVALTSTVSCPIAGYLPMSYNTGSPNATAIEYGVTLQKYALVIGTTTGWFGSLSYIFGNYEMERHRHGSMVHDLQHICSFRLLGSNSRIKERRPIDRHRITRSRLAVAQRVVNRLAAIVQIQYQ
jgi:hypothetical protein